MQQAAACPLRGFFFSATSSSSEHRTIFTRPADERRAYITGSSDDTTQTPGHARVEDNYYEPEAHAIPRRALELKVTLLNMSGDAQAALAAPSRRSCSATAASRRLIASDRELDRQENEIEESDPLLATQQPMARTFASSPRDRNRERSERVGDHAVNIAQSAERCS